MLGDGVPDDGVEVLDAVGVSDDDPVLSASSTHLKMLTEEVLNIILKDQMKKYCFLINHKNLETLIKALTAVLPVVVVINNLESDSNMNNIISMCLQISGITEGGITEEGWKLLLATQLIWCTINKTVLQHYCSQQ